MRGAKRVTPLTDPFGSALCLSSHSPSYKGLKGTLRLTELNWVKVRNAALFKFCFLLTYLSVRKGLIRGKSLPIISVPVVTCVDELDLLEGYDRCVPAS